MGKIRAALAGKRSPVPAEKTDEEREQERQDAQRLEAAEYAAAQHNLAARRQQALKNLIKKKWPNGVPRPKR
ncbi:MAG: hypothetical protein ABI140_06830 [Jatrophihabitantaceae bacterium]